MNKREAYSGMLLMLKKRMKCVPKGDCPQFKIFGHYDALDIHLVEEWYQMRPQGVKMREGNISLQDDYRDKYTLKVYFPDEEKQKKLCQLGKPEQSKMDYQIWKIISSGKNAQNEEMRSKYENICAEYPFLSLVFLNISEPMVRQNGELIELVGTCIMNAADKAEVQIKEIHGALFSSLGFCDYVLLFLCKNPKQVMSLLDCIKEEKVSGQAAPVISNFYPITGFEEAGLSNLENLQISDVEISVRINLQEGVSNRWFQQKLKDVLPEEMKESKMFPLFGSSDCLWMPTVPFRDCIKLYYNAEIFSPDSEFFQNYICHMHSSIRIKNFTELSESCMPHEDEDDLAAWHNIRKNELEAYRQQFTLLINKLENAASEYKIPIRIVYGIQNVMKMFLDLIRSSHCFDLEVVLGKMFAALNENVDYNLRIISALTGVDRENSIHNLWKALKLFREFVGSYLSDMQRSDRSFIEGHSLIHQSIGSSTKLLLFYNRIVNEVTEKLVEREEDNKNQTYTFLVTSGGTDVTEAYDLFAHLDPTEGGSSTVVVLSIPEMSLYDIRGTMFRLMHECLHFCGERRRKERYEYVMEALASYSSMFFCRLFMMDVKRSFESDICFNLQHMFDDDVLQEVKDKWEKEIQNKIIKEEKRLKEYICGSFKDNMEMASADYYSKYMYDFIVLVAEAAVFEVAIPEKNGNECYGGLSRELYESFLNLHLYSASISTEILRETPIKVPFSNAHFIENIVREKLEMCRNEEYCMNDQLFINACIQAYMGEAVKNPYFKLAEEDIVKFSGVLQTLKMLFKECYADCMAAIILNGNITDVVMSIVYETWDMERAFPDTHFEKLRRMVEKDILYGDRTALESGIQDKVECWKVNGYDSPACQKTGDKEKLCQRILGKDDEEEEDYNLLLEPVKEYLRNCLDLFKENISDFEKEQRIFKYAAFEGENDLQQLLNEINNSWSQYSREKRS